MRHRRFRQDDVLVCDCVICFFTSWRNSFSALALNVANFVREHLVIVFSGNLESIATVPVGSGRCSTQSARVPFDSDCWN